MDTAIVWFRKDLRLTDNPALTEALANAERIVPLYIYDAQASGQWSPGAASRWWLHNSLQELDRSLQQLGTKLIIRSGDAPNVMSQVVRESNAGKVYWNRQYEPAQIEQDRQLKQQLREQGLCVESFNAGLLFEPWQVLKSDGEPYKVFTPYWNYLQRQGLPASPLPAPQPYPPPVENLASDSLESLRLLPRQPWADGFQQYWQPGERGAQEKLDCFVASALHDYGQRRDQPSLPGTSGLSPHLHFGEIGPQQVVAAIEQASLGTTTSGLLGNAESYLRQLAWREFAAYLLYHFPHTDSEPFNPRYNQFPWDKDNPVLLEAWQKGRTGIPIIDAGMRELWHTGWMHNRVRMLVASLLTKNLLQHWQHGARWFWDTLVDADLAANSLGWQWTAGCGADAAPYFRVFNPVLQGQKFDPRGRYVRRWIPELENLPDKYLHCPWEAPSAVLDAAGVVPGKTYPLPIVDLKHSRAEALQRYNTLKSRAHYG